MRVITDARRILKPLQNAMISPILLSVCLAADTTVSSPLPTTMPVTTPSATGTYGTATNPKRVMRDDEKPIARATRSLTVIALEEQEASPRDLRDPRATDAGCIFAVQEPEPRAFAVHDLVTIVVSEVSKSNSAADAKAEKSYDIEAAADAWMNMDPTSFGTDFGSTVDSEDLPMIAVGGDKKFKGKGNYARSDTFTARVTAEIVEIRPNGLLIFEARREIVNDGESQIMQLSGSCRPEDVDANNQVQSQRIADAVIKKVTTGELRDTAEKGIVAKILDTIFAF
ncbi:MAG: flagellar basal body L-ring protein FlgH [Planctomycetota bacterium]|jgi:flagellar L-ring protein precursor FlgH|nr:MAG: flagellar basal body L-ring protein FlgH [Planctomycetota bacterium]RLS96717.1 MAG: flagellar basal body L-ring protein FlgH [Planctomycetota bacterium]